MRNQKQGLEQGGWRIAGVGGAGSALSGASSLAESSAGSCGSGAGQRCADER